MQIYLGYYQLRTKKIKSQWRAYVVFRDTVTLTNNMYNRGLFYFIDRAAFFVTASEN